MTSSVQVARKGLSEELTFEWRSGRCKGAGYGKTWDMVFQEEATASAKALRQRRDCKRKRRESCVPGAGRKVRRVRDEV